MNGSAGVRLGIAIVASAGLMALTIGVLGSAPPPEVISVPSDSPNATPSIGIAHYIYDPSLLDIVLQIGAVVIGFGAPSVLAARGGRHSRVLIGSCAAVLTGLLALAMLSASVGSDTSSLVIPPVWTICSVAVAAALIGGISAWIALRWWPNPSLERP